MNIPHDSDWVNQLFALNLGRVEWIVNKVRDDVKRLGYDYMKTWVTSLLRQSSCQGNIQSHRKSTGMVE